MADLVELKFSLVCECDENCIDEVGEYICNNMMCLYSNGENVFEWEFKGYDVLKR